MQLGNREVPMYYVRSLKRVYFLVNETQKCDHSNENPQLLHSNGDVYVNTEVSSF